MQNLNRQSFQAYNLLDSKKNLPRPNSFTFHSGLDSQKIPNFGGGPTLGSQEATCPMLGNEVTEM